ncbi:HEPN domain-containing protein [Nodosilinea sp. FACHB-131]|uniref:HEPN domain-containing protein n=1 Tax=Cyanophyceae TaxID=3028117 RepID=UPI001682A9EE|nr:HEPN domain-containing protein [Nodosilinea sp. FACHB-131]MBD1876727.1 HEPN domain-containing protein [Nodosilinea sp. FACHB-131]
MSPPKEDIDALVKARLQQAQKALEAGQLLFEQDFYADSINRFYYAMFYAVLALLVKRQLGTSKHKGAISLFDREFVKTGIFSKEMSMWLHRTFEQRLEVDYADLIETSMQDANECYSQAESFLRQVREYLQVQ